MFFCFSIVKFGISCFSGHVSFVLVLQQSWSTYFQSTAQNHGTVTTETIHSKSFTPNTPSVAKCGLITYLLIVCGLLHNVVISFFFVLLFCCGTVSGDECWNVPVHSRAGFISSAQKTIWLVPSRENSFNTVLWNQEAEFGTQGWSKNGL